MTVRPLNGNYLMAILLKSAVQDILVFSVRASLFKPCLMSSLVIWQDLAGQEEFLSSITRSLASRTLQRMYKNSLVMESVVAFHEIVTALQWTCLQLRAHLIDAAAATDAHNAFC